MLVNYESYLPPVLAATKEFKALDQTVDHYFNVKLWPVVVKQEDNSFITLADEDGIAYFEGLCGITPAAGDTLESRRTVVLAKWIDQLPYTYGTLVTKLNTLCGEGNYEILPYFDQYTIGLYTHSIRNIEEVEKLIHEIVPCNILMDIHNELSIETEGDIYMAGVVSTTHHLQLSTVDTSVQTISTDEYYGVGLTKSKHISIKTT